MKKEQSSHPEMCKEVAQHWARNNRDEPWCDRLERFAYSFLGRPYAIGACGEGPGSLFDEKPLIRVDVFDCLTYINCVLSMSYAQTPGDITQQIIGVNYLSPNIDYRYRCHFMLTDWIPANTQRGRIKSLDASLGLTPEQAVATIDGQAWFAAHSEKKLYLLEEKTPDIIADRLRLLHDFALTLSSCSAALSYFSTSCLLDQYKQLIEELPRVTLAFIANPDEISEKHYSSISHVGLVFKKEGKLFFMHAAENKCVEEECFFNYISRAHHRVGARGVLFFEILPA